MMKPLELRQLRSDELQDKLDELYKQLFTMRSQAMTENIENVRALGNVKRNIARVKTIIRENQLKGR